MLISPLRYPGGKAKLFEFFAALVQCNRLFGSIYCEPYAGGAGLALKLLSSGFVHEVVLNDIDQAIWAFWESALNYPEEICRLIETTPFTIDEWYKQREIWREKNVSDVVALGFSTFFLNRTNRSGIIEGAGPVGGYAQAGRWRLDARFDRLKQASSIRALIPYRKQIELRNLDAKDFIAETLYNPECLTYLDPPYYVKGSKLYRNSYTHDDHVQIMEAVSANRAGKWVVSYDDVNPIRSIYEAFSPIQYCLSYSAGRPGAGSEVIYLSDSLESPELEGFVNFAA